MKLDLDLDLDTVKQSVAKVFKDLRGNRLWPLAIVLLVAIVAVPIALSKTSSGSSPSTVAQGTPPPATGSAVPALNVQSSESSSRLPGRGRDPFGGQAGGATAASGKAATSTSTSTSASGAGSGSAGKAAGASSGATGSSGGASSTTPSSSAPPTSSSTPPPPITGNKKPTAAPSGLTASEAYGVTLAITDASGGLDTIDSLERLSVLPSASQPLLVELGVLQGGHQVLFAVQPGTAVSGPGTCTPGPIDCEILSLGQDQTEGISLQSAGGPVSVALFAVTGITGDHYSSPAAADRVRRTESAAGRHLLSVSQLSALSLFSYEPGVGAVVDLRNLSAGDVG